MDVVVRPHLLSEREQTVIAVAPGATLAEIVAAYPWPPGVAAHAVVLLDRQVVPREWWPRIRPKDGTRIDLTLGMRGGGNGKQILALVAAIAVSIAAPYAAMAILGTTTMTAGTYALAAGLAMVGNLALAAIFKPPPTVAMPSGNQVSKAYTFQGQSNAFKPYGVLPRVLGVHRVYPDVVGVPYTVVVGGQSDDRDNQLMHALYCFGYGGVVIDDIRIGDNP
ncbi:MAG TPA: hypothetical protein VMS92_13440, partial [Mycobacterium sp.]|nr:hypothetical protein [Mycobacterium sp.]